MQAALQDHVQRINASLDTERIFVYSAASTQLLAGAAPAVPPEVALLLQGPSTPILCPSFPVSQYLLRACALKSSAGCLKYGC